MTDNKPSKGVPTASTPMTEREHRNKMIVDRDGDYLMNKDKQGIVLDEKAQEQPKDKDRAQTAQKTENTPKKEAGPEGLKTILRSPRAGNRRQG